MYFNARKKELKMKRLLMFFVLCMVFLLLLGGNSFAGKLSGKIRIDGSSTVFPITEAVAEEFQKKHRKVEMHSKKKESQILKNFQNFLKNDEYFTMD